MKIQNLLKEQIKGSFSILILLILSLGALNVHGQKCTIVIKEKSTSNNTGVNTSRFKLNKIRSIHPHPIHGNKVVVDYLEDGISKSQTFHYSTDAEARIFINQALIQSLKCRYPIIRIEDQRDQLKLIPSKNILRAHVLENTQVVIDFQDGDEITTKRFYFSTQEEARITVDNIQNQSRSGRCRLISLRDKNGEFYEAMNIGEIKDVHLKADNKTVVVIEFKGSRKPINASFSTESESRIYLGMVDQLISRNS